MSNLFDRWLRTIGCQLRYGRAGSVRTGSGRRGVSRRNRPARPSGLEALESRALLSSAGNIFAAYDGAVPTGGAAQRIDFEIQSSDFTLAGGKAVLGFQLVAATGSGLDPAAPEIRATANNALVTPALARADFGPGNNHSLVLSNLGAGQYYLLVRGERGTVGSFTLNTFLPGDSDGNRQVDAADGTAINNLIRLKQYKLEADANLDGLLTSYDYTQWRTNNGDQTTLQPLALSATFSPAPVILPDGRVATRHSSIALQGTTAAGATLAVETGSDGGFNDGTATASSTGTFSVSGVALTEGANPVQLRSRTTARFPQQLIRSLPVFLDSQAPNLTILSPANNLPTNSNVTISGRVTDGGAGLGTLRASVDGGTAVDVSWDASGNFQFTTSLPLNGTADGLHTVALIGTDRVGNSSPSASVTFRLDTQAPTLSISSPAENQLTNGNVVVAGRVTDNGAGVGTLRASVDGGTPVDVSWDASGNFQFTTSLPLNGSADGPHTIAFIGTDLVGNASTPASVTFRLDTLAPTLSINSPADNLLTNGNVVVSGRVTDTVAGVGTLRATVDGGTPVDVSWDASGNFQFTTSLPLNGSADGPHTVALIGTDLVGNASSPASVTFRLDSQALNVTWDLSLGSDSGTVGDRQTSAGRVSLRGTTEPGITVTLVETGATALAGDNGVFLFTGVSLDLGDNALTIRATDAAGNVTNRVHTIRRVAASGELDPVLTWNGIALTAVKNNAETPPEATRSLAIVHAAILDTVNSLEGTPGRYVLLPAPAGTSLAAAIAAAAHRALSYQYPAEQANLDAALTASLEAIPDGPSKTDGITLGRAVADAILEMRQGDGFDAFVPYLGGTAPGQWRPTAPMYAVALLPQWGDVTPWVITNTDEYFTDGPPAFSSQAWADAFNEVKSLGAADSATRTTDQTQIARFWADGLGTYAPPGHWNAIAEVVADQEDASPAENARLFASLNLALADAAIACWDLKYVEAFWRPITAIRENGDGNPQTTGQADWTPLLVTPAFPEYVSGHSTFSGAASAILTALFGDEYAFTIGSQTPQNYVRSFSSFAQAAQEAGLSRIYGGIHFGFSSHDGLTMGNAIGDAIRRSFSTSVDHQAPSIVVQSLPVATASNLTLSGQILDNLTGVRTATVQHGSSPAQSLTIDAYGRFTLVTDLPTDGTADGLQEYHFAATDAAGNSVSRVVSFTLDTETPTVTLVSPAAGATLGDTARIVGSVDGTGSAIASLTYAFDGGTAMPIVVNANGEFDAPLPVSNLSAGAHTLVVTAVDRAGNSTQTIRSVNVSTDIRFMVAGYSPASGSVEVGVTVRPQVFFTRPVDVATLNSNNLYAMFGGEKLPATIVPSGDGTFAWLFFSQPMPDASLIRVTVDGNTIRALDGGQALDADGDGTAGGVVQFDFTTVSTVPVANTSLVGIIADPGPDLMPHTIDDVRPGPDGVLMTDDDIYLLPLAGVQVSLIGVNQVLTTGPDGRFRFDAVPIGNTKLVLNGTTATLPAGAGYYFPEMVMDLTLIPGIENHGMDEGPELYLPRLANAILEEVTADAGAMIVADAVAAPNLTPEQRDRLTIDVPANSLIGPDGRPLTSAQIGISTVPPELVRDMLPPGVLQHTFDITVQALGVSNFATPAPMTFPNVFGAAPGSQLNFLSFDHTTGRLVIEGTATVSQDGLTVSTDPGTGVTHPGWHGLTPPGGCGGAGGPPPPAPPPPSSEEDVEEHDPQALPLISSSASSNSFSREWTAPPENPDAPSQPPPPGCSVPPHRPDQDQQPFTNVTIEIDGPINDFLKPVSGGLPLQAGSFTLAAGSGETKKFGFEPKTYAEMYSAGFEQLDKDELYGARVKITVIQQSPDGTRTRDIHTYYQYRWVTAVYAPEALAQSGTTAAFLRTNTTDVTRTKQVATKVPGGVTTRFDGPSLISPFNIDSTAPAAGTVSWTFDPYLSGNREGDVDILVDDPLDTGLLVGDLTAKGTATNTTIVSVNTAGYSAVLRQVILGLNEHPTTGAITYVNAFTSAAGSKFQSEFAGYMPRDRRAPGPDGQPGFATVDDDGINGTDDPGEYGFAGSDDVFTTAQLTGLDTLLAGKAADLQSAVADDYRDIPSIEVRGSGGDVTMTWVDESIFSGSHVYGYADFDRDHATLATQIATSAAIPDVAKIYALNEGLNTRPSNSGQFGVAINMKWTSSATFAQFVANTVSHEIGHTFGLNDAYFGGGANRQPFDIMRAGSNADPDLQFDPKNVYLLKASMGSAPDASAGVATDALRMYQQTFNLPGSDTGIREFPPVAPSPQIALVRGDEVFTSGYSDEAGGVAADGPAGADVTLNYAITNLGTAPLTISSVAVTGNPAFALVGTGPAGLTIDPSQSATLTILYDPAQVGIQTADLVIQSDSAIDSTYVLHLSGDGRVPTPSVALTAPANNLGGVPVSSGSLTQTNLATITNRGSEPLLLSAFHLVEGSGRFSLTGIPADLNAHPIALAYGQSFSFGITFDPDQVGIARALIDIVTNDPTHPITRVSAVGTGLASVVYPAWGDDFQAIDTPNLAGSSTLRTVSDNDGNFSVFLPPVQEYHYSSFDPETSLIGHSYGTTPPSGRGIDLTSSIIFLASTAPDSDFDGLPDDIEHAIGTFPNDADTNDDGIDDFTAIAQGLDPLGENALPVGIVGTVRPQGNFFVQDVVASSNTAFLAAGPGGLQVVDTSKITRPSIIASVPTATLGGDAVGVAFTSITEASGTTRNLVAVALGVNGLAIVDATDPPAAFLVTRLPIPGSALSVEIVDNLAYVGGGGGLVSIVDMKSGELISTFTASGSGDVAAVKFSAGTLYTLRGGTLAAYDISANLAIPVLQSSLRFYGASHLFVGTDRAYVTGGQVFEAIDISDPANLRNTSGGRPALNYRGLATNGSGRLVVSQTADFNNANARIGLFNIENPDDTNSFLSEFDTPGSVQDVWIQNGLGLLADGAGGFAIFNYLEFDRGNTPPTLSVRTSAADSTTVVEGSHLRIDVSTLDDVQTRQVRVVANGVALEPDGSFPFSFFVDVPTLASGASTLVLEITATDTGGNAATTSLTYQIITDTIAPALRSVLPVDDKIQFNSIQAFRATFSEPLALSSLSASSVRVIEAGPDGDLGTGDDVTIPIASFDFRLSINLLTITPDTPLGPGKYELQWDRAEITDRAGNPVGNGVFRTQVTVQSIPFNSVINGAIDPAGEIDLYSFQGHAGDEVTLFGDWNPGVINLGNGQISLIAPNGVTILASGEGNGSVLLRDVALPSDGLYTIRIRAASTQPLAVGGYRFTISDPETAPETITYGQTLTRSIAVRGDDHEWQFTATAGDLVNFSYSGPEIEGGIRFFHPDGTEFAAVPGGSTMVLFATTASQTGTYRFVIDDDMSTGSYTIRLDEGDFADEVPGLYNTIQNGQLTRLYDSDRFRYSLAAGDEITIFGDLSGIGAGTLRLLDASTLAELVPSVSGSTPQVTNYVSDAPRDVLIEVRGVSGSSFRTGTYSLTVSDPETAFETLAFGGAATGTIAVRGDDQEWQFVALGGEVVTLGYRGPRLDQGIVVKRPDGSTLAALPPDSMIEGRDLTLDQAGTYKFLLADDDATGTYTLNLSNPADRESPGTALTANTPRSDAIGTVFDIDVFTFEATAGDSFSILAEWRPGGTGLSQGEVVVRSPAGAVVGTASGSLATSLAVATAESGIYSVTIRASTNNPFATGAYRLTAYRGAEAPTNDTLATAVVTGIRTSTTSHFEANGFVGDNLQGTRDVDLYQVHALRGDQIVIEVRAAAIGSDLNSFVRLFNAGGTQLAFNNDAGSSTDSYLTYTVVADGDYTIGVSSSGNPYYSPSTAGSGWEGSVGAYRILLDVAQDFTGPLVTAITPRGVSTAEDVTTFQVDFNERLNAASAGDAANYELVSAGADAIFGTADDEVIALSAAYNDGLRRVTLTTPDGADADTASDPLPRGSAYRLTISGQPGVTDIAGNSLKDGQNEVSYLELTDSVGTPTTEFPLQDGFESGALQTFWQVSTTGGSRAQVTTENTPTKAGTYHLRLDNPGAAGRVSATLLADLRSLDANADVDLQFFHRDGGDSNNPLPDQFAGRVNGDGVAFSVDGVRWRRLVDFGATTESSYGAFVVDLDGALRAAGLAVNSNVQILFQHYLGAGQSAFLDDVELAPDLAGPSIVGVSTPGPLVFSSSLSSLTIDFSEALNEATAGAASSYELRRTDTGVNTVLTPEYDPVQRRVTLATGVLAQGPYRLTVRGNSAVSGVTVIRDLTGNPLNNGADSVFNFEIFAVESTPDDELDSATATGMGTGGSYVITTAIGNNGYGGRDVDLYRFVAGAGDLFSATTTSAGFGIPPGLNTLLRLFDSSGTQIFSNDNSTDFNTDSRITEFQIPADGTYYIGVSSATNAAYNPLIAPTGTVGAIGKYRLNLSLADDVSAPIISKVAPHVGPNANQSISAIAITFSESLASGSAVNPANYSLLHLGADRGPGGGDDTAYNFSVSYDASSRVATLALTGPEGLLPLPVGAYRLRVQGTADGITDIAGNRLNGGTDAVIDFRVIAPEDPLNDRLVDAVATGITLEGGTFTADGAIGDNAFESRDVDLYRFEARDGLRLSVTLNDRSIGSGLSSVLRLFNEAGTQLTSAENPSQDDVFTYTITAPGVYFLGVSGSGNWDYNPVSPGSGSAATSTGEYILTILTTDVVAPTVVSLTPDQVAVGANQTRITARFSEPMDVTGAESAANYELLHSGPDRRFDTGDEISLPFTAFYNIGTREVTLTTSQPIANGDLRLTLKSTHLVDRAGLRLNGGADFVRTLNFVSTGAPLTAFERLDSANPGAQWLLTQREANAVVEITGSGAPRQGAGHLRLGGLTDHIQTTATAILAVLPNSQAPLTLSFHSKLGSHEAGYYPDRYVLPESFTGQPTGDGVAISIDGSQWYRVVDLSTQPLDTYQRFTADLTAAAASRGLSLAGPLLVRFSNTEYHLHNSVDFSAYFDDVRVAVGPATPVATGIVPGAFVTGTAVNTFGVSFSGDLSTVSAVDPANYLVVRAGADRRLGTADDVSVSLSASNLSYSPATDVVTFSLDSTLATDAYRVTVRPTLLSAAGDSINDGLAQSLDFDASPSEAPTNETLATATVTGIVGTVDGNYQTARAVGDNSFGGRDVDLYSLQGVNGNRLLVRFSRFGVSGSHIRARVFNAAGTELASGVTTDATPDGVLTLFLNTNETVYVGLSAATNSTYAPGSAGSGTEGSRGLYSLSLETRTGVAVPPLTEGFEDATLPPFLTTYTSDASGLVASSANRYRTGARSLLLGDTNYAYTLTEATLTVDAVALPTTQLSFWAQAAYYEPLNPLTPANNRFTNHDNGDGVSFSVDGTTWYVLTNFATSLTSPYVWTRFEIDLNAAAAAAGVTLTDTTRIRFQNYAYGVAGSSFYTYGIYVDDVRIDSDEVGPSVTAATGLDQFEVTSTLQSPTITFNESLDATAANRAANYLFRSDGPDNTFDTADDAVFTVTPTYVDATRTTTLALAGVTGGLPADTYRLRLIGNGETPLVDVAGNWFRNGTNQDIVFAVFPPEGTPDNTLASATPTGITPVGGVYTTTAMLGNDGPGTTATFDDEDLYRIDVAANQSLYVQARGGFGAPNLRLRLFDATGTQLMFHDPAGDNLLLDRYALSAAGTYYVGISETANDSYNPTTGTGDIGSTRGVYNLKIQVVQPASFPFADGFESGIINASHWEVYGLGYGSGTGVARIESSSPAPLEGSYSAVLHGSYYSYAKTDLTLHLDLSGQTNVELRFQERNNYDYYYGYAPTQYDGRAMDYYGNNDGVFLSVDGIRFYQIPNVFNATPGQGILQRIVDLDEFAALNGLTLGATTQIRFEADHYYYDYSQQGRQLDAVQVLVDTVGPALTSLTTDGGSPATIRLSESVTQFVATFDDRLSTARATDVDSYGLLYAGTDGLFAGETGDTGDDSPVPVSPSYDGNFTVTLSVDPALRPLNAGRYRLLFRGTGPEVLTDREGNPLQNGVDVLREYLLVDGGPRVVSSTPSNESTVTPTTGLSSIALSFSEPVLGTSFTGADLVIRDESGIQVVPATDISLTGSGQNWTASFPAQRNPGRYSVTIGPQLTDLAGNAMNQDFDTTNGEDSDAYSFYVRVSDSGQTTLYDSLSNRWDVTTYNGTINDGGRINPTTGGTTHSDSYDGMYYSQVSGSGYSNSGLFRFDDGGRTITMPEVLLDGLRIHRETYIPTDDHFARFIDVLHNPGTTPITRRISGSGNLGSDGATVLTGSGSGDLLFGITDTWLGTDDADGSGDLSLAHVFMDGKRDTLVSASRSGDNLYWGFDVTVGPGQTVRLMTFAIQETTREAAGLQAERLVHLPATALANLSAEELGSIINFDTGVDSVAPFVLSIDPAGSRLPQNSVTQLSLIFSEKLLASTASNPNNFTLLSSGPDRVFGTEDDLIIWLIPSYSETERRVTLLLPDGSNPLPLGEYRLTVRGSAGLTDLTGNELNGGVDQQFEFGVYPPGPVVTGFDGGSPDTATGWSQFRVTFDGEIVGETFTGEDVAIYDPNGYQVDFSQISVTQDEIPGTWIVSFPTQSLAGYYSIQIGPEIYDFGGEPMNQDGDSSNGEPWDDRYFTSFAVVSPSPGPFVVSMTAGEPTTTTGFGWFELVFDHEIVDLQGYHFAIYNYQTGRWMDSSQIVPTGFGTNWSVDFPTMYDEGWYYLQAGPFIYDFAGEPMNQDGDSFNGESSDYWSGYLYVPNSSSGDAMRLAGARPETQPLGPPETRPQPLDSGELPALLAEARKRWAGMGISPIQLASLNLEQVVGIQDLPGSFLGLTVDNRIWLDPDAAGAGWFVDATPGLDEEFLLPGLSAGLLSRASGRADLLTVLMHEIGHLLGFEHGDSDEVMSSQLRTGVRLVPSPLSAAPGADLASEPASPDRKPSSQPVLEGRFPTLTATAAHRFSLDNSLRPDQDFVGTVAAMSSDVLPIEAQVNTWIFTGLPRRRRRLP